MGKEIMEYVSNWADTLIKSYSDYVKVAGTETPVVMASDLATALIFKALHRDTADFAEFAKEVRGMSEAELKELMKPL